MGPLDGGKYWEWRDREQVRAVLRHVSGLAPREDSAVASDAGATADRVRFCWIARHNRISERRWIPRVATYPPHARFRYGGGRLGEVRRAADFPVGIAGNKGMSTAFALETAIPALLRQGAMGLLGVTIGVLARFVTFTPTRGGDSAEGGSGGALNPECGRFSR